LVAAKLLIDQRCSGGLPLGRLHPGQRCLIYAKQIHCFANRGIHSDLCKELSFDVDSEAFGILIRTFVELFGSQCRAIPALEEEAAGLPKALFVPVHQCDADSEGDCSEFFIYDAERKLDVEWHLEGRVQRSVLT
jgi:hypothetical protein